MRTEIVFGSSGTIEMSADIPVPTTYLISDIKNPDTRKGAFSKTITIPGSKNNDRLFAHIFEIDIDCAFNPNIRTPVTVLLDGIPQLQGHLRLMKIKSNDDNRKEYECTIIGAVSNIFTVLGASELTALDLSAYDHTYNKTNQVASWTAPVGIGYVYPMIDYGYTNGLTYDVENFYPATYVKTYVDKIFSYAGFTYESNFLTSNIFKRLIIPFNSDALRLSSAEVLNRMFNASIGSSASVVIPTGSYTSAYALASRVPYNTDVNDPSNQFNTSTYTFKAGVTGNYNLTGNFTYQLNSAFAFTPIGYIHMIKYSGGVWTTLSAINFISFGGIDNTLRTATITASAIDLLQDDEVYIGLQLFGVSAGTPNLNIGTGNFFNSINNIGLYDGNMISMNNAIPPKIKMKDFLMSLVKMFNLYIETDKTNSNKLYIEPRNDFYANGVVRDWTSKLDLSKDLEIEPMGELDAKRFIFSYTDDKDYYNELYKKTYLETYGTYNKDITNEFVTGTKDTKIIFSPTPLVNDNGTDRTIPEIYGVDSAGNIKPKVSNIRILYYGGVVSTAYNWTYTGDVSGTTTETTYAYAGHLDSVTTPTIDLSFGVPREVYYDALSYTNNNLYNTYYKKFIEEITNKDSKVVTGHFRLTPSDIHLLDFRDEFYVDGHFLRLNKVYDYDAVRNELTKCEFLLIKNANDFVPETILVTGTFGTGDALPNPVGVEKPSTYGMVSMRSGINFIDPSAERTYVSGTRNCVGQGCTNVEILNSSGCIVNAGLHGVTIINSSGIIVTDSDVVYINSVLQSGQTKSGTYTPTLTTVSNLTNKVAYECQYTRVGDVVTVSGMMDLQATLVSTLTRVRISLPIASGFTALQNCGGVAFAPLVAGMGGGILANDSSDEAFLGFISTDLASNQWAFTFTYRII